MPQALKLTKNTLKLISRKCTADSTDLTNMAQLGRYYVVTGLPGMHEWAVMPIKAFNKNFKFEKAELPTQFAEVSRI